MKLLTLSDMKDRMSQTLSELDILELLEIDSEQLVERFEDLIQDKFEYIQQQLEE